MNKFYPLLLAFLLVFFSWDLYDRYFSVNPIKITRPQKFCDALVHTYLYNGVHTWVIFSPPNKDIDVINVSSGETITTNNCSFMNGLTKDILRSYYIDYKNSRINFFGVLSDIVDGKQCLIVPKFNLDKNSLYLIDGLTLTRIELPSYIEDKEFDKISLAQKGKILDYLINKKKSANRGKHYLISC